MYMYKQFIDKNLNLDKKYSVKEMLKTLLPKGIISLKVTITNGKVSYKQYGEQKKNRVRPLVSFLTDVAKKYTNINTTCLFHLNDWGSQQEIKEYPIFVFSKYIESNKNIVIPDHLFLRKYDNRNRLSQVPYNQIINQYRYKVPFEKKENTAFMRAGTSKNKLLINMFKDVENTDVNWSKKSFLSYEKIFTYKYAIMHYMRWDTVYMILKSDFVTFMYTGFGNYLWYDLFLDDGEDYISFNTIDEYKDKRKQIEDDEDKQKLIMKSSTEKADQYFTYNYAVDYVGNLLFEYQKYVVE